MKANRTCLFVALLSCVLREIVGERNTACVQRTVDNHCCQFPFRYKGIKYRRCTQYGDASNRFWCATEGIKYSRNETTTWGYCKLTKTQCLVKTTDGECCLFPFRYRGEEHNNCVAGTIGDDPNGSYWCATRRQFDRNMSRSGWGHCTGSTCFSCRSNKSWEHCNKNMVEKICPYKYEHCSTLNKEEMYSSEDLSKNVKILVKDCASNIECSNPSPRCKGQVKCLHHCCHGHLCNAGNLSVKGSGHGILALLFAALFGINGFPQ